MQVVYWNHSSTRASHKALQSIFRLAQTIVFALAVIGALHLIGASPFAPSTASPPDVIEPVSGCLDPYTYFPSQFVNQATELEEPIEQF